MDALLQRLLSCILNTAQVHNVSLAILSTSGKERDYYIEQAIERGIITQKIVDEVLGEDMDHSLKKEGLRAANAALEMILCSNDEVRKATFEIAPKYMECVYKNYLNNMEKHHEAH